MNNKKAKLKTDVSLAVLCGALKKTNNFLLVSHVNPEGDAIG